MRLGGAGWSMMMKALEAFQKLRKNNRECACMAKYDGLNILPVKTR